MRYIILLQRWKLNFLLNILYAQIYTLNLKQLKPSILEFFLIIKI